MKKLLVFLCLLVFASGCATYRSPQGVRLTAPRGMTAPATRFP